MSVPIELSRLNVYSKGNTTLVKNGDTIVASQLLTPTDGVIIETDGASNFDLSIAPVNIENQFVFGTTLNIQDEYERWKSVAQWSYCYDPAAGNGRLVFNSHLEGEEILLQVFKDGKEVYQETIVNEPIGEDKNWILVAIAVAALILSNIDYKKTVETKTGSDGKTTTTTTTTKSVGGGGTIQPTSSEESFEFDHLYITSSITYNADLYPKLDGSIKQAIFTGNFGEVNLNSIQYDV